VPSYPFRIADNRIADNRGVGDQGAHRRRRAENPPDTHHEERPMDSDEGIHIESGDTDEATIPSSDTEPRDPDEIGTPDPLPEEDVEAEEQEELEAEGYGIPDEAQPETQGEDPFVAELGEEGNGDLAPEDL
jgi:hypothetical protein